MAMNPASQVPLYVRELDPLKAQAFQAQLRAEQNPLFGFAAGVVAALIGAVLWAVVTVATNFQFGYMAIAVAFLVGWAVRHFGKGVDIIHGVIGAGLAFSGCVAGNLLMLAAIVARQESASIFAVFTVMVLRPVLTLQVLASNFAPVDLLFYGFALYYGYRYSFRRITSAEQESLYRQRLVTP
jgi:hypothetical protein